MIVSIETMLNVSRPSSSPMDALDNQNYTLFNFGIIHYVHVPLINTNYTYAYIHIDTILWKCKYKITLNF